MQVMLWVVAVVLAAAGIAAAESLTPLQVAWFTDNGDRAPLQELRDKPEADLTATERAILTAANRIGWIQIKGCNRGSHAILINLDGRDAVVTSRHLMAAGKLGRETACDPDAEADFYQNISYLHPEGRFAGVRLTGDQIQELLLAHVPLQPGPLNLTETGILMLPGEDWLVFFLARNLSQDPMPDWAFGAGQPRGTIPFPTGRPRSGTVYVIGQDGRYTRENGRMFTWQQCRMVQGGGQGLMGGQGLADTIYIDCDVAPGASSSLLGTVESGEMTFQGLVTGGSERLAGNDVPTPKAAFLWNIGTSSAPIQRALAP